MDKKQEKRNEIIKASIESMFLQGYNGTSVKDLTDKAGIPKGSFYNYFSDKEDYAIKAMEYFAHILTISNILENKNLNPIERIQEFFKTAIKRHKSQGFQYGCFVGNLTQELGSQNDKVSQKAREIDETRMEQMRINLEEAKQLGLLTTDMDSQILASFILDTWQGAQLRMKMKSNEHVLDDFYTVLCGTILK